MATSTRLEDEVERLRDLLGMRDLTIIGLQNRISYLRVLVAELEDERLALLRAWRKEVLAQFGPLDEAPRGLLDPDRQDGGGAPLAGDEQ